MELHIEIFSKNRSLLGFSYNRGGAEIKNKKVIFHEFGIGVLILNIYITFY